MKILWKICLKLFKSSVYWFKCFVGRLMNSEFGSEKKNIFDDRDYLDYLRTGDSCVEAFPRDYKSEIELFLLLDSEFITLMEHLNKRSDLLRTTQNSEETNLLFSEVIYKLSNVTWRQSRNAFYLFMRHQSYDGNLVFRRSLEASVFAFRISRRAELARVYFNSEGRKTGDKAAWKKFESEFILAELPTDLPNRNEIKDYKDIVNDYHSHPGKSLISYSVDGSTQSQDFLCFDPEGDRFEMSLYAFLTYVRVCCIIWRKILGKALPISMTAPGCNWDAISLKFEKYQASKRSLLGRHSNLFIR